MRVLLVHNYYTQPGGEEVVMEREAALLRRAGHEVVYYRRSNDELKGLSPLQRLSLPARMLWATDTARDLRRLIGEQRPDVAHFHNPFVMMSPSAYHVCKELGVPVVQSLHNPRLMCPAASFYRNGRACVDCLGKTPPWPGIVHGCYRGSRAQTAAMAAILTWHRWTHTWDTTVKAFIVFSEFYKQKFIEGGLPADRLFVKPHFVAPDPGMVGNVAVQPGEYALYVGRLDPEKGIPTLLRAWKQLPGVPVRIRGEGQLLADVHRAIDEGVHAELVPRQPRWGDPSRLFERLYAEARFLVWPSEGYYETFGLTAIEAYACGIPVIASRTGVMPEIVRDGDTGVLFTAGDADDLAEKVRWAWSNPAEMRRMGRNARARFEQCYTADPNYHRLMEIYGFARDGG